MALVKKNAALMLKDSEITTKIVDVVDDLLTNTEKQEALKKNILAMALHESDIVIAKKIIDIAGQTHKK